MSFTAVLVSILLLALLHSLQTFLCFDYGFWHVAKCSQQQNPLQDFMPGLQAVGNLGYLPKLSEKAHC